MSASPSPSPRSRTGRSVDRDTPREHHGGGGASRDDNVGTIFVGNLNRDTSERRLREYFDTYGRVLSAKIVINPETQMSKGFGFVKFEDQRDAEDAIREAGGKILDGRPLKCNYAKYNGPRAPYNNANFRGGGGRGGGDYSQGRGFRGDFRGGFRGARGGPVGGRGYGGRDGGGGYNNYNAPYNGGEGGGGGGRDVRGRSSRSPGRYSPGRYSPAGRYSPRAGGADASPAPARSRSGSPVPKRRRAGGSKSPPRGAPPVRSGKRRSGSVASERSSSYSSTDSGGRSGGGPPGGPPALGDLKRRRHENGGSAAKGDGGAAAARTALAASAAQMGALKGDLAAAKRREDELGSRLAALEVEVASLRGAKADLSERVLELTERLQKEQEASKQYKKWLGSLGDCARAMLGARAALATATSEAKEREDDLTVFLEHADTLLLARGGDRSKRRHRASGIAGGDKGVPAIEATSGAAVPETGAAPMATDEAAGEAIAAAAAPAGPDDGSWADDAGAAGDDVAAKFKPGIKFKLAA